MVIIGVVVEQAHDLLQFFQVWGGWRGDVVPSNTHQFSVPIGFHLACVTLKSCLGEIEMFFRGDPDKLLKCFHF